MHPNSQADHSPLLSPQQAAATTQMKKNKTDTTEPPSYSSALYKGAGSAHDKHFARSPSQLHLASKSSHPGTRLNQSN